MTAFVSSQPVTNMKQGRKLKNTVGSICQYVWQSPKDRKEADHEKWFYAFCQLQKPRSSLCWYLQHNRASTHYGVFSLSLYGGWWLYYQRVYVVTHSRISVVWKRGENEFLLFFYGKITWHQHCKKYNLLTFTI